jgi:hypothetical protein
MTPLRAPPRYLAYKYFDSLMLAHQRRAIAASLPLPAS